MATSARSRTRSHLDRALKQLRRASRIVSRRQGPDRRTGQRAIPPLGEGQPGAEHDPSPGREPPRGHPPQDDDPPRSRVRHDRRGRPQRRRHGPQPAPVPPRRRCRVRRDPTPAHLQEPGGTATRLVVADRWYPSSKTCSRCGVVKAKLPLSMRVFECDDCGLVLDRDANAAHNLAALAAPHHRYRSGRRPGPRQGGVEAPWSRPQDPRHPPAPQGRDGAGRWHNPQPPGREKNGRPSASHQGAQLALW